MTNTPLKPALVIGNGPSIDKLDPQVLPHFSTYGCNHIYKKFPDWKRSTDYVFITDAFRTPEIGANYAQSDCKLFVGNHFYCIPPRNKIAAMVKRDFQPLHQLLRPKFARIPLLKRLRFPDPLPQFVFDKQRFSNDFELGFNFGCSVVYSAIQTAVIHGHKVICVTGVDTDFTGKFYFGDAQQNIQYLNKDFIADPRRSMEPMIVLLQLFLERHGVTLLDCTPGGKLKFVGKGRLITKEPYYEQVEHRLS